MSDIYERIRTENIEGYGTKITNYGPVLLANLYNDRTHFIYELLQNAEDACERAKKAGKKDKFVVYFYLFKDRLEVRHNGILFDEDDVRGICRIAEGTKKEDLSQIGKFGIGFKSVYAFTKSPEVYSGDWSFMIKDYVHPYPLHQKNNVDGGGTLFILPFNHEKISMEDSFARIKKRLLNLDFRNLLFLSNLSEIKWEIMGEPGYYSRKPHPIGEHVRKVELLRNKDLDSRDKNKEEWLVFERPVALNGSDSKVEVAFCTVDNHIVPFNGAKLVSFFLTDKDTYLKFLIQGPYKLTPARDNIILDDETNTRLLKETAILISESISKVKEMSLLNVGFLNTLPIESEYNTVENTIFCCMYNRVKERFLSEEALLPAHDGGYVNSAKALIVRAKESMLGLLGSEQLDLLFKKEGVKWLDENITQDKTPVLRDYLMKELNVSEVDPEKFAREFTEDFIKAQSDDWVKQFYGFLLGQERLWKEGYPWQNAGILRSKPIIRLNDDKHSQPFGGTQIYLPSRNETYFVTVKKSIVADERAEKFLRELGLREPDVVDDIICNVLPKYGNISEEINAEKNEQDVKYILETLRACSIQESKNRLLNKLGETSFLMAVNLGDSQRDYKKPCEIYLSEVFTKTSELNLYFEGNGDIWFLDEHYTGMYDKVLFEQIGCKDEIGVKCRVPDRQGHVVIADYYGSHRRGLDGFDPECTIDGLEYVLQNINLERAKVIWDIVKKLHKCIYGTVESSSRRDFIPSEKTSQFSRMGTLLVKYSWLPDKTGNFHKPEEFMLTDFPDDFDKESPEARHIAKKLGFKADIEQELFTQLPEGRKKVFELVDMLCQNLSVEDVENKLGEFVEKMLERGGDGKPEVSVQDIEDKFKESLENKQPADAGDDAGGVRVGLDPDEEEDIRKNYGAKILDRLRDAELKQDIKLNKTSEIAGGIDPKEFLFEQYGGHCQICNTILNLGANRRPLFDIYRIVEIRNKHAWSNMEFNVFCLCPNCHALMKHGGAYLKEILETAEKVIKREIAPEEVDERGGDFYIMNIVVAGEERQIFYTPTHMAKVAAFVEKGICKE